MRTSQAYTSLSLHGNNSVCVRKDARTDLFAHTGIGAENAVRGSGAQKITTINMKHFDAG